MGNIYDPNSHALVSLPTIYGAKMKLRFNFLILLLVCGNVHAQTDGRSKIAEEARSLGVIRHAAIQEMGRNGWQHGLGNAAHPETKYRQVWCYILASVLEFPDAHRLKVRYDLSGQDFFATDRYRNLNYMIGSIDEFRGRAASVQNMTENELLNEWNISCAIEYPYISGWLEAGETFYTADEHGGIHVLGKIETGYARKLMVALTMHPRTRVVYIGSGGGNVSEAMAAGRLIRQRGLSVQISGKCFSACPLVLAGGVERRSWTSVMDGDQLGFHKISVNGIAISNTSPAYLDVYQYLESMGVDGQMILALMFTAEPQGMTILNATEPYLCVSRILNQVKLSCRNGQLSH